MIREDNLSRTGFFLSWYFHFKVCLSVGVKKKKKIPVAVKLIRKF